jgi:alkanesulfonate monooxygenase SsuD/methylene tetrahydromethanopterin reductase-like flavin-dependent oxidoreductase (luciferase family)
VSGSGYLRSEFDALGRSFETRNDLFDEALEALQIAFGADGVNFEGTGFTARGAIIDPSPVQLPHPPIWIGGSSKRSRQRAAKYGSGWAPLLASEVMAKTTRSAPMATLEDLERAIGEFHELIHAEGKNISDFSVQIDSVANIDEALKQPDEHLALIVRLEKMGVTDMVLRIPHHHSPQAVVDVVTQYGEMFLQ